MIWESNWEWSQSLGTCMYSVEDPDEMPACWLQSGPAPGVAPMLGMNLQVKVCIFLKLSLLEKTKQKP